MRSSPISRVMLVRSLLVGLGSASAYNVMPRAAVAQLPTWNQSPRSAHVCMQVKPKAEDIYDEFMALEVSGASVPPRLVKMKEKLYLECLDSFYNEGGKELLPDNKYAQLEVATRNPIPTPTPTPQWVGQAKPSHARCHPLPTQPTSTRAPP